MQDQLRALIRRHCHTLAQELEAVRTCVEALMGPRNSWAEAATQGIALTHKIKGSSGSIGFMQISEAAALLEQKFRILLDANQQLTDDHKAQIFRQFEELSELITSIKPEASTLFDANFSL